MGLLATPPACPDLSRGTQHLEKLPHRLFLPLPWPGFLPLGQWGWEAAGLACSSSLNKLLEGQGASTGPSFRLEFHRVELKKDFPLVQPDFPLCPGQTAALRGHTTRGCEPSGPSRSSAMDTCVQPRKQQEAAQTLPSSTVPSEQRGTGALRKPSNTRGLTSFHSERFYPMGAGRSAENFVRRPRPQEGASAWPPGAGWQGPSCATPTRRSTNSRSEPAQHQAE